MALVAYQLCPAFLPTPQVVARTELQTAQAALLTAGLAAAVPDAALAARVEEEDEAPRDSGLQRN